MIKMLFIAIKQNFLSVAEISGWQDTSRLNPEQVMTRVYGALKPYNPNLFGGYMLSTLPASLILIFIPLINHHKKTALCGLISFLLVTSLFYYKTLPVNLLYINHDNLKIGNPHLNVIIAILSLLGVLGFLKTCLSNSFIFFIISV